MCGVWAGPRCLLFWRGGVVCPTKQKLFLSHKKKYRARFKDSTVDQARWSVVPVPVYRCYYSSCVPLHNDPAAPDFCGSRRAKALLDSTRLSEGYSLLLLGDKRRSNTTITWCWIRRSERARREEKIGSGTSSKVKYAA